MPNKRKSNFKSSLRGFVSKIDRKQVERRSIFFNNRNLYEYPISDVEGFFELYKSLDKEPSKLYEIEDGYFIKIQTLYLTEKAALFVGLYRNKTDQPPLVYLQSLSGGAGGKRVEGFLQVSYLPDFTDEELEKLKNEITKRISER